MPFRAVVAVETPELTGPPAVVVVEFIHGEVSLEGDPTMELEVGAPFEVLEEVLLTTNEVDKSVDDWISGGVELEAP